VSDPELDQGEATDTLVMKHTVGNTELT